MLDSTIDQPKAAHKLSRRYRDSGLFDAVTSFADLETRIAHLPSKQERGDAFEVFTEAYLATQPEVLAKEVWPFGAIPLHVQAKLSLQTLRDMGVDGVIQTRLGDYQAYQAKFRSQRDPLEWRELSTFMGLTDQVSLRVLVTNSNDLPELMNSRSGFYCIRGSDLDRMGPRDFDAIRVWLASGVTQKRLKSPLPHQLEALEAILSAFKTQDRATAVMACGSGKTLLSLWVAEALNSKNILVLLPSLALVRQTLHEWLHETKWASLSYLCVCSDPTVIGINDALVVKQSDLDFPVTTDPEGVRRFFLRNNTSTRIVFSTYQSAHVVAGGLQPSQIFDVAIFDEAHKTAGREGGRLSFALSDHNLPITKRLFLTATPRHYDVRAIDKDGDSKLVFSMDAEEVFGKVVHTLKFAEAVKRGIICDYKVVISVVTSEMVTRDLLSRGEVNVNGDMVLARQVANQIALQRAIEQYGVNRIISFHSNVKSARSFASQGNEGVGRHITTFDVFHVNGEMRTAERSQILHAFGKASQGLISNARCLTEGIDVPAVDMVAFMSPRKSKVDIVQATGRAMRKAPGKSTGYVLLPVYLEQNQGESLDDALLRTDFQDVWDVLQAMKEQDGTLSDIVTWMCEEQGRTKGYDDSRFRERVETIGPSISLDVLRRGITARCIERVGVSWDQYYGKLLAFKERFGHCNVPQWGWPEDPSLPRWASTQRQRRRNGLLLPSRIERLNNIGFVWERHENSWEQGFTEMEKYGRRFGHFSVPMDWAEAPFLRKWINGQREAKRKQTLDPLRQARMDAIGFVWNPPLKEVWKKEWTEMYLKLRHYRDRFGDCDVPQNWSEDEKLGRWVTWHRIARKRRGLKPDREQQLNEIGFNWGSDKRDTWDASFSKLQEYCERHGDCRVPMRWPDDPQLGKWVSRMRMLNKGGKLNPKRRQALDDLRFDWTSGDTLIDRAWEENYLKLVSYKQVMGHCEVPPTSSTDPQLSAWVATQRRRFMEGRLKPERIRSLESLGFEWLAQSKRGKMQRGRPKTRGK